MPIHFVPDHEVERDCNTLQTISIDTLPDEIIEIIISTVVFSSQFSWPDHRCNVYNQLRNVNTRFRMLTKRVAHSMLPRVYISSGSEPGTVSIRKLIKTFGPSSGVVLELKSIISHPKWANVWLTLVFIGFGWFTILKIFWKRP